MGANDRAIDERANKRERAKAARQSRRRLAGSADWREFDWSAAAALTMAITDEGGALRIGKTRDGGAWSFGVYKGEDYAAEYIRPNEVFVDAVREIAEAWCEDGGQAFHEHYLNFTTPKKP